MMIKVNFIKYSTFNQKKKITTSMGAAQDNFKESGLPLFILCMFLILGYAARVFVRQTFVNAMSHSVHKIFLLSTMITAFLSIFILWSAAWTYGILSVFVGWTTLATLSHPRLSTYKPTAVVVGCVWVLLLIGVPPTLFGPGVLQLVNTCESHYNTVSSSMCKEGWLAFLEIVALIMICISILNQMLLFVVIAELTEWNGSSGGVMLP
eukprot:PhF_6_TR4353/c1_g1_i1/m.5871